MYQELQTKVLSHSHDLKLADIDIEISQHRVLETRASYYPVINVRYTNEWFEDFTAGTGAVDSVDGTVISSSGSRWKNVTGASLNYNLFDFGIRSGLYANAKRDVEINRLTAKQDEVDLKLQLLELYVEGVKVQERYEVQTVIHQMRRDIFILSKRLHKAGRMDRLEMGEAAIAVAEVVQQLDDLSMQRAEVLFMLSQLSGENYDEKLTTFSPFDVVMDVDHVDYGTLPDIQAYQLAINNKQVESRIASKSYLPRFTFYSNYNFYGSDNADWTQSVSNVRNTSFSCGITLNINLFNGFADQAKARRLQAEAERLKVERDKKMAEHENRYRTLQHHTELYGRSSAQWQQFKGVLDNQASMTERLADEQIVDRVSLLNQQLQLLTKEQQVRMQVIDHHATLLRLQILGQGYGTHNGLSGVNTAETRPYLAQDTEVAL
jgi:outer membrane protein TolC